MGLREEGVRWAKGGAGLGQIREGKDGGLAQGIKEGFSIFYTKVFGEGLPPSTHKIRTKSLKHLYYMMHKIIINSI